MLNPLIGIFYYYRDYLIIHEDYQKEFDPVARIVTPHINLNSPGEHRDLWDNYMIKTYPELMRLYDDNHKLLPRGRVGFYMRKDSLRFLVTLDKCIINKEDEIKSIYHLKDFNVEFSYGTLNYVCRDCGTMNIYPSDKK